jgi:hypothetical protein
MPPQPLAPPTARTRTHGNGGRGAIVEWVVRAKPRVFPCAKHALVVAT